MLVSLLLFDKVAAAVINPTRLADFDLGCRAIYVGPGTAAADALLALVFRFLARRTQDFLLQIEKKSANHVCTVFFPYPLSPLPVTYNVDCCCAMFDCME